MSSRAVHFRIGDLFAADDPIARWIVSLSLALNDMRLAAEYAVRPEQPYHERLYFVRLLASHLREAVKIVVLEHRERSDVQQFVASMDQDGRDSFAEVEQRLDAVLPEYHGTTTTFDEIKRLRDLSFHYARDPQSQAQLEEAIRRSADEEGIYRVSDRALRAEYGDLISTYLVHPFDGPPQDRARLGRAMHQAIVGLIGPLSTFLHAAEATYFGAAPPGTLRME